MDGVIAYQRALRRTACGCLDLHGVGDLSEIGGLRNFFGGSRRGVFRSLRGEGLFPQIEADVRIWHSGIEGRGNLQCGAAGIDDWLRLKLWVSNIARWNRDLSGGV